VHHLFFGRSGSLPLTCAERWSGACAKSLPCCHHRHDATPRKFFPLYLPRRDPGKRHARIRRRCNILCLAASCLHNHLASGYDCHEARGTPYWSIGGCHIAALERVLPGF